MTEAQGGYPPRRKAWLSTGVIFLLTVIAMADRMAISIQWVSTLVLHSLARKPLLAAMARKDAA